MPSASPTPPASPPASPAARSARPRDPLTRLGEFLQRRGLKHSRQREAIVHAFFELGGHVPVEAVVERVRRDDPRVGLATVYRTMKLLAECGLAVPRRFADGQTRYEPATRPHADTHDHLICTGCGAIVEFESERISALQLQLARRHGFEVDRRRVELYGRCAACRRPAGADDRGERTPTP